MDNTVLGALFHISKEIVDIEEFTLNLSLEDYRNSLVTRRDVERALGIIGEACTRIRKAGYPDLLVHQKTIISFRNFLIHAYDSVNIETIWTIVRNDLPQLKVEVLEILSKYPTPDVDPKF